MKTKEYSSLILEMAKELDKAVKVYESVKAKKGYVWAGSDVKIHYTRTAIERRIVQMRQELNILREELNA